MVRRDKENLGKWVKEMGRCRLPPNHHGVLPQTPHSEDPD